MTVVFVGQKAITVLCAALMIAGHPLTSAVAAPLNVIVKPLADTYKTVDQLKSMLTMKLDGKDAKKAKVKGDMQMSFAFNTPKKVASMEMSGPLVTLMMGSDAPVEQLTGIGMYDTGEGAFMLMDGKTDACTKIPEESAGDLFGDNPMQTMGFDKMTAGFERLSAANKLAGQRVGDETTNGIATTHYALDPATMKAFNAEVKKTSPANADKSEFKQGELWVANAGNYIVQFRVQGTGELKSFNGFKGNVDLTYGLSDINNSAFEVKLPEMCGR